MFKQFISGIVCLAVLQTSLYAGIAPDKAVYRGGTVAAKIGDEAKFSLVGDSFTFGADKKGPKVVIPYEKITSIEYGQKAGRRIGAAVGLAVLAGPIGFLALMSKKRNHMVSLTWRNDDGRSQGAVFEFGKDSIRPALNAFEAGSGVAVEYETEDAKKNIGR